MADDKITYKFEGDASSLIKSSKAVKKSLDTTGKSAKKADKNLKGLSNQATKSGNRLKLLNKGLVKVNTSLRAGARSSGIFAAAILGAGAAIGRFLQATADAQNELSDLSSRTGVSTRSLAGLRLAAKGSGQDFKAISSALKPLALRLGQAAQGSKTALLGFEGLGVAAQNADGSLRSADDVLIDMTESLSRIEDPTERAAAAALALGNSGTKLVQALGGKSLEEFNIAAEKFGMDTGPRAAKAADDWQRSMADLDLVMRPFTTELMELAVKQVNNFSLGWVYLSTLLTELSKNIIPNLGNMLLLAFVDLNLKAVNLADDILQTFVGAIAGYAKLIEHITGGTGLSDKVEEFSKKLTQAKDVAKDYWDQIKEDIGTNTELGKSYQKATEKAQEFWEWQQRVLDQRGGGALLLPDKKGGKGAEGIDLSASGGEGIIIHDPAEDIDLSGSGSNAKGGIRESGQWLTDFREGIASLEDPTNVVKDSLLDVLDIMVQLRDMDFSSPLNAIESIGKMANSVANLIGAAIEGITNQNETLSKKQRKTLKALFVAQKAAAISSVIMETAIGIARAFAVNPIYGALQAAVLGVNAAIQIASISSQKPPFHGGGIIPAAPGKQGVQINALPGEAVLTRDATQSLGAEGVASLNSGGGGPSGPVVEMVYKHRIFDTFISDNIAKGGPLAQAIQAASSGSIGKR